MINENVTVQGQLKIVLMDKDGTVKETRDVKNLIVQTGTHFIASRMRSNSDSPMSHMAIGTSSTATDANQTALISPQGAREPVTHLRSGSTVTYSATFGASATTSGAIKEAGILDAATNGTMLCRTVFPVVNKQDDDIMQVQWSITINAAT